MPTPTRLPPTLKALISACWSHNPKNRPPFSKIVNWLDEAMLEVAIENVDGRAFWREAFVLPHKDLQERVSWHEFVRALASKTKIRDKTKFDHLYELIGTHSRFLFFLVCVFFDVSHRYFSSHL
jgi:hypothetical protein